MERARAMRISANLPHDLWSEIINCAVYLQDRTSRESIRWMSPYEKFHTFLSRKTRRPILAHLKAYSYRAYIMISNAKPKKKRLIKLNPRAYIRHLISYNSTNIYRIQITYKGMVISIRDVIFNKITFFNGKRTNPLDKLIAEIDILI